MRIITLLILISLLLYSKISKAQSLYVDPTTTGALMIYSDQLRKEQKKTRDTIKGLKRVQGAVGLAMAEVGRVQKKVLKGLNEVSGIISNAYKVKEIGDNILWARKNLSRISEIAKRHPQYSVFAVGTAKKAQERIVKTSLELTNVLTGGELNLMTAGDRQKVLEMINNAIMMLRVDLMSILMKLEQVERIGFWKSINPFQGYINTDRSIVKNILSIGLPTAGENLAWNVGQLMIVAMVNTMGTTIIASRTYLMLISSFTMTLSIALGQGTAIQVGHLVGAGEIKEVYHKCLKSLKIAFIFAFVTTSLVFLFRKPIMSIFTTNPDILKASLKIFPLMILLEMGRVFNIVIINSLHAAGDIKFPMFMGIICVFVVAVLFSYIFGISFGWGLAGIWIANAMDEWIRGLAMYFRWKSKKWQNKSFV